MSSVDIAILKTGLVSSVGFDARTTCAAIRAKINNFSETRFTDLSGDPIIGAVIPLTGRQLGRKRLAKITAIAIKEVISDIPNLQPNRIPFLLCISELDRPGRTAGLENYLYDEIQSELHLHFHEDLSRTIAYGRASIAQALIFARDLLFSKGVPMVLIAAVDSLLSGRSLTTYERRQRLLTTENSNGFIPGEGAGAVLVTRKSDIIGDALLCLGIGVGQEVATVDRGLPLRADALTYAVKSALSEAQCDLADLDYRLTDANGEQYFFKEASLTLSRILRQRKERHYLITPADCVGEIGAAIGPLLLAVAFEAGRKSYWHGTSMLMHCGSDTGLRSALVLRYTREPGL